MNNQKARIYALGPQGTNGHQVALSVQMDYRSEIVFLPTHTEIFERVLEDDDLACGIVPIVNTSSSLVSDVIDYWRNTPKPLLQIVREISIPVRHHLLVRESVDAKSVKTVYSRGEALVQCRKTIKSHGLNIVSVSSTALAAQLVSESNESIGVLGSEFLASCWGLTIGIPNMHDNDANETKFHVVAKHERAHSGEGRTAILFRVDNRVGSLVDVLGLFREEGINIAFLHSLSDWTPDAMEFYCEVDAYVLDFPPIDRIQKLTENFRMLGSYNRQVLA